jgi:hypothetical protein
MRQQHGKAYLIIIVPDEGSRSRLRPYLLRPGGTLRDPTLLHRWRLPPALKTGESHAGLN